ncbi:hypothetical protein HYPSUDRAFT_214378 [Hypholoma sublateritium FD-334 SS-4]|uniref:F-box domain-containing protein n=1 Tax=Hypholoma sublateritium (strain FD-334 SS-4) TaxID=945553 RepID=A0A0D2LC56_HYPSF|nr:hypothetical protein HYPSUDRAFT_214378 [Hypholoma sublateritium FD-334 SS-4]
MPLTRTTSPIYNLNRDILWYIFEINADMFAHADALEITRKTSQVCRSWRVILLGASQLWARLIDLDTLPTRKTHWRDKVFRRGRAAPLWIKGVNLTGKSNAKVLSLFFLDLLGNNWHRIQVLVVHMPVPCPMQRWAPLFSPAPHLETFNLNLYSVRPINAAIQHEFARADLFSRDAPKLRSLSIKSMRFDLTAPWWKQLRTLELTAIPTVRGVLDILSAVPSLERLRIDNIGAAVHDDSLPLSPITTLPNLEHLTLTVNIEMIILLLDSLQLPLSCTFVLSPKEQYQVDIAALSIFVQRYLTCTVGQPKVSLYRSVQGPIRPRPFPASNDLDFKCRVNPMPQVQISTRRTEKTLPSVSRTVEYAIWINIDSREIVAPFIALMQAFPSVETLAVDEPVLCFLNDIHRSHKPTSGEPNVLFPFLRTLQLRTVSVSYSRAGAEGNVARFVHAQGKGWHPLEVLDLTQCQPNIWPDLRFLEQVNGLKVIWKFGRCGEQFTTPIMTLNPSSAPIHRLNHDILLHILKMNGDMFSYKNALNTTRITSQVCHHWRKFMLETPSLWAKLIDLDRIAKRGQHMWRNELVKRSGAALLWIRAEEISFISSSKLFDNMERFFFDLIGENWPRIQKLVAKISVHNVHPTWWTPIFLPAPYLHTFNVTFWRRSYTWGSPEEWLSAPLFAGHAPKLRTFVPRCYIIDVRAPWLHNLHSLTLSRDDDYTVGGLLAILSATHNLQELDISSAVDKEIPPDCSLYLHPADYRNPRPPQEPQRLISPLSRYVRRYFQSHPPTKLSLSLYDYLGFGFSLIDLTSPKDYKLNLAVPHVIGLNVLEFSAFSSVTELEFEFDMKDSQYPCLIPFLTSLPALTTIHANSKTLAYLTEIQNDLYATEHKTILFPLLTIIKFNMRVFGFWNRQYHRVSNETAAFIMSRICLGRPIATLDLTMSWDLLSAPDLDSVEEFRGLMVRYGLREVKGIFEYVCGSEHIPVFRAQVRPVTVPPCLQSLWCLTDASRSITPLTVRTPPHSHPISIPIPSFPSHCRFALARPPFRTKLVHAHASAPSNYVPSRASSFPLCVADSSFLSLKDDPQHHLRMSLSPQIPVLYSFHQPNVIFRDLPCWRTVERPTAAALLSAGYTSPLKRRTAQIPPPTPVVSRRPPARTLCAAFMHGDGPAMPFTGIGASPSIRDIVLAPLQDCAAWSATTARAMRLVSSSAYTLYMLPRFPSVHPCTTQLASLAGSLGTAYVRATPGALHVQLRGRVDISPSTYHTARLVAAAYLAGKREIKLLNVTVATRRVPAAARPERSGDTLFTGAGALSSTLDVVLHAAAGHRSIMGLRVVHAACATTPRAVGTQGAMRFVYPPRLPQRIYAMHALSLSFRAYVPAHRTPPSGMTRSPPPSPARSWHHSLSAPPCLPCEAGGAWVALRALVARPV